MTLSVEHRKDRNEVVIRLPEQFDFKVHRDFRSAYSENKAIGASYIVDLGRTKYMDSSALGMLLQLREHAGSDAKKVHLVNIHPDVMEILRIANLDKLLTIN
ncbi:MAG: STAS domain-containing protein [Gammaproteobacteria bacterium]